MNIRAAPPPSRELGGDPAVRRYEEITDLLPSVAEPTPLVRVRSGAAPATFPFYLKLEWFSPFGSIKDRTAAYLLAGLEARGELDGRDLVEASSGNTAIALAALAARRGIKLTVTIPDGIPEEKKVILRMLGAEVWETPDELCPVDNPKDGAIALARSLAGGNGQWVMPDQYENPDNVAAHYETTGPEIWRQTDGQVRAFIAGFGTCGTLTGVGRYLKEQDPSVRIVAVEPQQGHRIPGMKSFAEAKEPGILDWGVIDEVVRVDDDPAYTRTQRLFREEGLIVGPSTGAIVEAAASLELDGVAVGVSPDGGQKYASFFADVLGDDGLPAIERELQRKEAS